MDHIDAWERREQDHQQGQPRWAIYNEKKVSQRNGQTPRLQLKDSPPVARIPSDDDIAKGVVGGQPRAQQERLCPSKQANIQYFTYATIRLLLVRLRVKSLCHGSGTDEDSNHHLLANDSTSCLEVNQRYG